MGRSLSDVRRKMKAVKSTRQVTKAMELVAASKMRKAVQSAHMLRSYALAGWRILQNIAAVHQTAHPFLTQRPVKKVLVVLLTSDRGLCGSFNSHICKAAERYLIRATETKAGEKTDFVAVGKKGQQFLRRTGSPIVAAFPAFSNHPTFRDVLPLCRFIIESFKRGDYDHVVCIYSRFRSALTQEVDIKVLLPLTETELQTMAHALLGKKSEDISTDRTSAPDQEFIFEPSATEVLDVILPQLTEVQIYQAILENAASEHSARMVAMHNASDNASDILDDLTLMYNQTRQAGITAELSELSATTAALS